MSPGLARVGVVGGGQMGAGIAEVCARAGLDTVVCEADAISARAARDRVAASLERAVQRGKLAPETADDARARIAFTGSLDDLADRQSVVEAIVENPDGRPPPELSRPRAGPPGTGPTAHRHTAATCVLT